MVYVPHRGDLPARFGEGVPLIPDIGPAELDSRVYTDPARFEAERRKVLNRSWQIICRSSELPGPGDHVVWEGQGETIVISRRRDGGVSGFHNVCQHRGARIVPRSGQGVPLIPEIGPSELDSSVYTDPARFEAERRKVLNRSWQIICRSSEITSTGDHVVWEGQGETIVVSRRRDGGVSGFHNVCQHRGARIVPASGQRARRFTCRWHSWSYDLEGTLVGVPDREDFDERQLKGACAPPVE